MLIHANKYFFFPRQVFLFLEFVPKKGIRQLSSKIGLHIWIQLKLAFNEQRSFYFNK